MRALLLRTTIVAMVLCLNLPTFANPSAQKKTLVIDDVVVNETPQSGTWLMCFTAQSGDVEATFNEPDREFSGDGIKIRMNLKLSPVSVGDKVDFYMRLDDDQADVCVDSAEDKSSGSFLAGDGSKQVTAGSFNYIVHFRMVE
jgi:hypothetical protein